MGECVRLILPDRNEAVQGEILDRIVSRWGGVTMLRGFGLWGGQDVRQREPILVLECSIPEWNNAIHAWWGDLARSACILFGETCIFWSRCTEYAWLTTTTVTDAI